jgi:outer membrane protein assembly complex protein YaeT
MSGGGRTRWLWAALGAVLAALGPGAVARADVPLELRGRAITSVEVAGETAGTVAPEEIGVALGTPLTRALLRATTERLLGSLKYADVQLDVEQVGEGVRLIVTLVPRLVVLRIQLSGNEALEDEEVLRAAQVSEGGEVRPEELGVLTRRIESAYAERGYVAARATASLRDTDDPARKVLFLGVREGRPARLRAVRFAGETPVEEARELVLAELGLHRGDVVDRRALGEGLRAAQSTLREHGWLEASLGPADVADDARGATIDVRAHIGPRYDVVLRGHAPLSRDTLSAALALRTERLTGSAGERGLHDRVVDLYVRHGFLDARVEVRREAAAPGHARLVIAVTPGEQLDVVGVGFPGASHFDTDFLRDQVVSYLEEDVEGSTLVYPVDSEVADALGAGGRSIPRPREVPEPLLVEPARVYYAPTYTRALQHIEELYQADGFLGARVGPERIERLGRGEIAAVVPVIEGPQTRLHAVSVTGNTVLGARELLMASGLERGAPFGYLAVEEARGKMQELYRELGYLYALIEPEPRFSADRTRAEVTFHVVERFPVRVGGVVFRGLARTSESLVRSRLRLREGDLYRPSLARRSEELLLELGVFSGATIAIEDEDLPAREKRLVVTLSERRTQYLDASLGISTGQGIRAGFEYGYRNLAGTAVSTSLRVQLGYQFFLIDPVIQGYFDRLSLADRLERRVTLAVTAPYIWGLPNVHASIEASSIRHNERQFGYDNNGAVLSLAWRQSHALTVTLSGELENNSLTLFGGNALADLRETAASDPRLSRLLRIPSGESTLASTRLTTSVDLRDNPFTPTSGLFSTLTAEYARTLRTEQLASGEQFFSNFIKLSFSASGYVPLAKGLVLALQFRIGRVFAVDPKSETYPNRQYFLGGVDSMRGYLQDALIPQEFATALQHDVGGRASPSAIFRGGDAFVLARAELRFPIFGALGGGAFLDAGNVWADARGLSFLELRPTAGLGLRLATPVGPLAFDYGFVLLRRSLPVSSCSEPSSTLVRECAHDVPFEPLGAFHFSIGLF